MFCNLQKVRKIYICRIMILAYTLYTMELGQYFWRISFVWNQSGDHPEEGVENFIILVYFWLHIENKM